MRLTQKQKEEIASAVSTAMFSLLWEGDYSLPHGPGEDELYDTVLRALNQMTGRKP